MADPNEIFEIVDENNKLIGQEKRGLVHQKGFYHRSVHILVWNAKNELLLQKRSDKKDVCPGRWDISCAEHLQPGEAYIVAAARGLREELGIQVSEADLKRVKAAKLHVTEEPSKGVLDREFNETFEIQWLGDLKLDPHEVAGARWITLPALKEEITRNREAFTTWFAADYALLLASR